MTGKLKTIYTDVTNKNKQALPAIFAAAVILSLFYFITSVPMGWISWGIAVPAWLIIAITALARLYDIKHLGWHWQVRRIGMVLAGVGAVTLIAAPLLDEGIWFPTWRAVLLYWGFALTWLTTPAMPPWHKYISGEWKLKKGQQG